MRRVLLTAIVLLAIAVPTFAHHGTNISYDRSKMMTVKGVVTEFHYANPHPQLYVDVKDDQGKVTNWGCEIAANVYQLSLAGWSKQRSTTELKAGTPVTVTYRPQPAGPGEPLVVEFQEQK